MFLACCRRALIVVKQRVWGLDSVRIESVIHGTDDSAVIYCRVYFSHRAQFYSTVEAHNSVAIYCRFYLSNSTTFLYRAHHTILWLYTVNAICLIRRNIPL